VLSPIEFERIHYGSTTNIVLRSERCGCQRELLVALVFFRTLALLPLLSTAPSVTGMSPSCVRRSPRSGQSALMLSNRSHVSSGVWRSFDKLLGHGKTPLSPDIDVSALHQFFDDKVAGVREATACADEPRFTPAPVGCELRLFTPVTQTEII